jgi:2-methylcitrate dehydratase PrpD
MEQQCTCWTSSRCGHLQTTLCRRLCPQFLALAESRQTCGKEIITALVKGIEVQGWIREAGHAAALSGEIFHPPGIIGPIGSAVAEDTSLD